MADATDKEPVAGLSAASSCIRLSIQSSPSSENTVVSSFRPVYTHQCFENECIEGWAPTIEAEQQSRLIHRSWISDDDADEGQGGEAAEHLHKSYQCPNFPPDRSTVARLDVHILLSPSCDTCKMEIHTECSTTSGNDRGESEPLSKKIKSVSFEGDENGNDRKTAQMDVKDIVDKIALATPPIASVWVNDVCRNELLPAAKDNGAIIERDTSSTEEKKRLGCQTKPIGQPLKTYHRKGKEFIITLADGADPEAATYHSSIQPLARWFIETADDVDIADTSRGTWKVMHLFQYHDPPTSTPDSTRTLGLAGYITLLHVNSPFRKPRPGIIVRVCQALIFPPYHRAGHGSEMLKSLHDYADKQDDCGASSSLGMDILEINVEDPAPAFVALRDSVDYHRFVTLCNEDQVKMKYLHKYDVTDKQFFAPIEEENELSVSEHLKITKRQTHIVHEIYKLHQIENWKENANDHDLIQQVDTNFRLMVKKSLRSLRQEELGACQDGKEGQKVLLGQWFDETLRHYHGVLRSNG